MRTRGAGAFVDRGHGIFLINSRPLKIRLAPDPVDSRALAITCEYVGIGVPPVEPVPTSIPLPELVRFNRCDLYCPKDIAEACGLDFAEVIAGCFTAAARSLGALVQEALARLGADLAQALHARVREVLPSEVAARVYLYFLADSESMYLADAVQIARAIEGSAAAIDNSGPPLLALCEFYNRILAPDETAADEVLRQNATLTVELAKSRYDLGFVLAEEVVFRTPTLLGQPLVREGEFRLIAGYPASLRAEYPSIESALSSQRQRMAETMRHCASRFVRMRAALQSQSLFSGIAGPLGTFSGAVIKELLRP